MSASATAAPVVSHVASAVAIVHEYQEPLGESSWIFTVEPAAGVLFRVNSTESMVVGFVAFRL